MKNLEISMELKNKPTVPSVTTYLFKGDKISLDNTVITTFKQVENKNE